MKDISISSIISESQFKIGKESFNSHVNNINCILKQHVLPSEPLQSHEVTMILSLMAFMDSNNDNDRVGMGEREARVFSSMVADRSFQLCHGIGRSGDLTAEQPKAPGSSMLYKLTTKLLKELVKTRIQAVDTLLILPQATGCALNSIQTNLKLKQPKRKQILWPRIDQKSCIKSMNIPGDIQIVVIEPVTKFNQNESNNDSLLTNNQNNINFQNTQSLTTNIELIKSKIEEQGKDQILCIASTTSCFSPRQPDNVVELSVLCLELDIPLVINNAQGLQSDQMCERVNQALNQGRVDAIVSSLDKNFMVPVGSSVVYSKTDLIISIIDKNQPGRASIQGVLDIFITLCQMGKSKYKDLIVERQRNIEQFLTKLNEQNQKNLNKLEVMNFNDKNKFENGKMKMKGNDISFCLKLDKKLEFAGKIWHRRITGCKVFNKDKLKEFKTDQMTLDKFGVNTNDPKIHQMTVAISIGLTLQEIDIFFSKIPKIINEN